MNQSFSQQSHPAPVQRPHALTVITLVAINVIVFALYYLKPEWDSWLFNQLALWPLNGQTHAFIHGSLYALPGFEPWQLISYGFLHGSFAHIFFNMYALLLFGSVLELRWGWRKFLLYYIVCVLGAGLAQLAVTYGGSTPTVGASGGVFGLLLAFGVLFPRAKLYILFIPMPIDARWAVLGYGLLELTLGVTNTMSGIAHFAHLGGMVAGLPLVLYWKKREKARNEVS